MVLRIERVAMGDRIILRLSGRLQSDQVGELKAQIDSSTKQITLDLGELKLVDQQGICFLAHCEISGVELSQCSPFIRDWVTREKTSPQVRHTES